MKDYRLHLSRWRREVVSIAAIVFILAASSQPLGATPYQLRDTVVFGANEFRIAQLPLEQIIDERAAREDEPILTVTSSVNNKGYFARWTIQGEQLLLIEFKGRRSEERVRIGDIIDGAHLPLRADWFTGKLQFAIGESDDDARIFPLIIEVEIKKGKVTNVSAARNAAEVFTWNGLPNEEADNVQCAEQPDETNGTGKSPG